MRGVERRRVPGRLVLLGLLAVALVASSCSEEEPAATSGTVGPVVGAVDLSGFEFEVHQDPG